MSKRYRDTASLIAELQPDAPLNCLCIERLREHVEGFVKGFPGTVAYAVKANPAEEMLAAVCEAGISAFDVASLYEISLLRKIKPDALLLYDNPVKARHEIDAAYREYAVRNFALDDARELQKIHEVIGSDSTVELAVRFNVGNSSAIYDLGKKFGTNSKTAAELLGQVARLGYRPALTFHPGSQCTRADAYNEHIAAAARIAAEAGATIDSLNVGGGFPTVYPNSGAPTIQQFFSEIEQQFLQSFPAGNVELRCEPGRALVDPSVSVLTRVKHRRELAVVFLNDGIYGSFMEQLLSRVELPTRVFRGGEPLQGPEELFTVFGPTCDSLDVFSYEVPLPTAIAEGDWIEFGEMGGYGSCSSTRFNGFETGDYVFVENGFVY